LPLLLTESAWSLQPEASGNAPTGSVGDAPSAGGGGGGGPPAGCGAGPNLLMLVVMGAVFYFMLIRPQQKQQKQVDDMRKALRKGDKVRTSGGIRGEVVELNEHEVVLLIADKVKINVLRSAIGTRIDKTAPKKLDDKTDDKGDKDKAASD